MLCEAIVWERTKAARLTIPLPGPVVRLTGRMGTTSGKCQ